MNAEEAMLEFMGRPEYVPMKLEAIMLAIGGDKSDLRQMRKVIPGLIRSGAIAVKGRDLLMLPAGKMLPEGTILFRQSGSARVVFTPEPGQKARDPVHMRS
ncbi:MAG: hypothetical protein LW857_04035 [Verrucomicrobiae bacterium]|nr:hypothetical protein [Verrucomicrobiae bacterium]